MRSQRYHDATKHTVASVTADAFVPDLDDRPLPFKIYETLPPIPLPGPDELPDAELPAIDAIATAPDGDATPDLAAVARLCFYANGVTRRRVIDGQEYLFRASACTGALYHVELYVACADLAGLPAGLYHYGAHDHALRRLRAGDVRRVLVEATGGEPAVADAPAALVLTSTFWRNAWKYRTRAWRHTWWDSGTLLANLLAVAAAHRLAARLVLGYADAPVNALLDVDPDREAAVGLVALGRGGPPTPAVSPVAPLRLPTTAVSRREIDHPLIREAHAASSLTSGAEAAAWRGAECDVWTVQDAGASRSSLLGSAPAEAPQPASRIATDAVIRRRGSSRRFAREPIQLDQLMLMLDRASRGVPLDCRTSARGLLSRPYLLVNAVAGLTPGAYVLDPARRELAQLGPLREERARWLGARLSLGQALGADAAVNVFYMVDLPAVLGCYGERGYRLAQLDAAISAGRLYLAAYALGLGATGLTFFDDDVTTFFSPYAVGLSVMFLIVLGVPQRIHGQHPTD